MECGWFGWSGRPLAKSACHHNGVVPRGVHGFTEPMRVLILLANLCVLIWPAKCVLFLLANLCTLFVSKFVLANVTKSRQDICMGATQQRSMSSQWSCPKRCLVWTSSRVYLHGFTEPMRVLILLANSNLASKSVCTIFASKFV